MPDFPLSLIEIERRIAAIRGNLRELEEQAAAISGAAVEELNARRIADQEAQLQRLVRSGMNCFSRGRQPRSRQWA